MWEAPHTSDAAAWLGSQVLLRPVPVAGLVRRPLLAGGGGERRARGRADTAPQRGGAPGGSAQVRRPEKRLNALHGLLERWRAEADAYARDGVPGHAALLRRVADELATAWSAWWTAERTVGEGAAESAYSADRLRELVREGKLPARRAADGGLRLRRCDLPRRPGVSAPLPAVQALATQVLAGRR